MVQGAPHARRDVALCHDAPRPWPQGRRPPGRRPRRGDARPWTCNRAVGGVLCRAYAGPRARVAAAGSGEVSKLVPLVPDELFDQDCNQCHTMWCRPHTLTTGTAPQDWTPLPRPQRWPRQELPHIERGTDVTCEWDASHRLQVQASKWRRVRSRVVDAEITALSSGRLGNELPVLLHKELVELVDSTGSYRVGEVDLADAGAIDSGAEWGQLTHAATFCLVGRSLLDRFSGVSWAAIGLGCHEDATSRVVL